MIRNTLCPHSASLQLFLSHPPAHFERVKLDLPLPLPFGSPQSTTLPLIMTSSLVLVYVFLISAIAPSLQYIKVKVMLGGSLLSWGDKDVKKRQIFRNVLARSYYMTVRTIDKVSEIFIETSNMGNNKGKISPSAFPEYHFQMTLCANTLRIGCITVPHNAS